jgi:hypothetical protein
MLATAHYIHLSGLISQFCHNPRSLTYEDFSDRPLPKYHSYAASSNWIIINDKLQRQKEKAIVACFKRHPSVSFWPRLKHGTFPSTKQERQLNTEKFAFEGMN